MSFADYARVYDLLYRDKPYAAEVDYLEALVKRFVAHPKKLVDIACGTGNHLVHFASRGYACSGSDASAQMIELAQQKSKDVRYQVAPMRRFDFGDERFDAIFCLFSAIDYVTELDDLRAVLHNVARHLAPGGVFVCDFWNGLAAIPGYSPVRVREVAHGSERVMRVSTSRLDALNDIIEVHFDLQLFEGDRLTRRFSEDHRLRYFFPRQMRELFVAHGFSVEHLGPFPSRRARFSPPTGT